MPMRPPPPKRRGGDGSSLRWVLTYADTLTLLFTLFVVLWALNASKTPQSTSHSLLGQSLKSLSVVRNSPGPAVITGQAPGLQQIQLFSQQTTLTTTRLNHLKSELQRAVQHAHLQHQVAITENPLGVRVSLAADLLFPSGHARLTPKARDLLVRVAHILNTVPKNPIEVVGYTDSVPMHSAAFHSNWQLGAVRAANVTEILATAPGFNPTRLMQTSFSKYRPIASNKTPQGQAKNRRVDILVMARSVGTVIQSTSSGSVPATIHP